jgi:hypothetical protein
MTNQNACRIMFTALAIALALGIAGFLYYLRVLGVSTDGLVVAFGMTLFVSAMTVAGGVLMFWRKAQ